MGVRAITKVYGNREGTGFTKHLSFLGNSNISTCGQIYCSDHADSVVSSASMPFITSSHDIQTLIENGRLAWVFICWKRMADWHGYLYTDRHGRIKKPRAPGPGHVEGPPPTPHPPREKMCAPQNTHARTHTHTQTQPMCWILRSKLDTLANVLGK